MHLHAPSHLDHDQRRAMRAAGLYHGAMLAGYRGSTNGTCKGGEPILILAGLRRGAVPPLVSQTLDARKTIQTDS